MIDQIVDAVVAMHDARLALGRQMAWQPFDQPIHRRQLFGLRGLVLSAPPPDLAGEIIAGSAEIGKTDLGVIDRNAVQR